MAHHVVQRGNHRERVFFVEGDFAAYLDLFNAYARKEGVEVFAYCLMLNHVHLVVVPTSAKGLYRALQAVNSQYAQRVNRMRGTSGHLWQGRYYASALDPNHFLNAVRYVERNPVAAGLVARAEDYRWSSAAAHCGARVDRLLQLPGRTSVLRGIADWSSWLAVEVSEDARKLLQRNLRLGLPCGSDAFVEELGRVAGRNLQYLPRGGQPATNRKK